MLGIPLADKLGKIELKKAQVEGPKQVFLPKCGVHMNYYERKAEPTKGKLESDSTDQPTLIFFHGFTSSAREFFSILGGALHVPANVRVLTPEQIGHGADLKRAFKEGDSFQQPDADVLIESTSEFLDVLKVGDNCNALGTSFGG